jgi:hypothetical protein
MDRVGPANGRRRRLGDAEVGDLAGLDQLGRRPPGLLHRHRAVHPVLVVQVDMVDAESLQRGVAGAAHVLRPAVDPDQLPSARCSLPNLVATTTSSWWPASARPTSRSLVNGPYMSAVSSKVTPRSRARRMVATDSPARRPARTTGSSACSPGRWLRPADPGCRACAAASCLPWRPAASTSREQRGERPAVCRAASRLTNEAGGRRGRASPCTRGKCRSRQAQPLPDAGRATRVPHRTGNPGIKSSFPTFDRILLSALAVGMIRGHDHHH